MGRKKKKHKIESSRRTTTRQAHPGDRLKLRVLKPENLLIGVFILALFIRLLYLNQIISTPVFHGMASDTEEYENFALQILKGNFTPKDFIYLNTLYPFFLSLIYLIFGQSHLSVVFTQGVIDSISCVVIYYIASMLFNKRVGIIAALIYACYGIAIFYTGILLAPTVVIFFTLLFIASLIFAEEKRWIIIFFISGILFGLVILARPNVILFLFLLPLWFFTTLKNKLGTNKSIQGFLLLLVGFFMVTSLITIRNYSIEKRFSPFSVQGGINFYIGNNPEATGRFMSPHGISTSPIEQVKTSIHYAEKESGKTLAPSQASRYWLFKGLNFIKDNPLDAFFLYAKKFALFWRKEEIPLNIDYSLSKTFAPIFLLPFISFGIIAPFAILFIIFSLKSKKAPLLITLFIFSYMISVIFFFVSARYRLPIAPYLIICCSYVLYRFAEMIRAKDVRNITILFAVFILLFAGINKNFEYFKSGPSSSYHISLGSAYLKKGMLEEATTEYKKALTINPRYAKAHHNLGVIYTKKGRLDEAISEYKKALAINSNLVETHINIAAAYIEKGWLDEAISECRRAHNINPNLAMAYQILGLAYSKKGRLDEAIAEYKKALTINPNLTEAFTNLGILFAKKGMFDESIAEYKKALTINPDLEEAYYNLGFAYAEKGRLDEAITEYKKALVINPNFVMAHVNLGAAYIHKGRFDEAITECKKALAINPNLEEPYNNLAWIYATSPNAAFRNGEKAVYLATKACELTKFKKASLLGTLAAAYAEKGNFSKAVEYQRKAIELAPPQKKKKFQKHLKLYKSGYPYRDQ